MRVLGGEFLEGGVAGEDVAAEVLELGSGLVAGGGGDEDAVGILPGGLAAGALVLDENVRSLDLLRRGHLGLFRGAVLVLLVAVGAIRRRLPLPIGIYFGGLGDFSLQFYGNGAAAQFANLQFTVVLVINKFRNCHLNNF